VFDLLLRSSANRPNITLSSLVKRLALGFGLLYGALDGGAPSLGCLQLNQLQLGLMLFFAPFEVELLDDLVESFDELLLVLDATDQLRLVVSEIDDITLGLLVDNLGGIRLFQNLNSPRLQSSIIVKFVLLLLVDLSRIDLGCLAPISKIISI